MTGTKTWVVGEEVLAPDFNSYVQTQVVAQFANAAARDAWGAPPVGAFCVTTDDGKMWQRYAGRWGLPWAMPWGEIARGVTTTPVGGLQALVDIVSTGAFTTVANRKLRVTFAGSFVMGGAAGTFTGVIADGANTNLQRQNFNIVANTNFAIVQIVDIASVAGSVTYKGRAQSSAGAPFGLNGAADMPTYVLVDDIGPNGAPA